jgi:hypothetical protein
VKLLTERYAVSLPKLAADAETFGAKVDVHLRRMGFAWS